MYDYVPGKSDWLARGLPTEGDEADRPRAGALARDDVVTCRLDEPGDAVLERVRASPYGFGLVVAADGTLLGRLRRSVLEGGTATTAEAAMEAGPSTVRCDTLVSELRERLDRRGLKTAIVSTPEGRLVGVVLREALG